MVSDAHDPGTSRRDLLRKGGGLLVLGALGGLTGWLLGRNDPCARPQACAACRHLATCAKLPARAIRKEVDHGG